MMNYLQKKKKAMLNYVQSQPSGYDVTIRTYNSGGYKVDVTVNGNTTTYTMSEVEANPVDCGCLYLTYRRFGSMAYVIVSKGTLTYNGVEYTKGKAVNDIAFNNYNTFEYSGVNEPTPSGVTEFYMPTRARFVVFTDTDYCFANLPSTWTQIGCIEFMYGSGATTIKATKDLMYNGVVYTSGSQVLKFNYGGIYNVIFEEV